MIARAARALASVALLAVAMGVALEPLKLPMVTRALTERYGQSEGIALSRATMLEAAESVRMYVVNPGGDALPASIDGTPAFGEGESEHLDDVAAVLTGARYLTLALTLLLALAAARLRRRGHGARIAVVLRTTAVVSAVLIAGVALAALIDFDRFFAAFHSLFFARGTWTFPFDSLLIRLFPEQFWVSMGVAWGTLTGAIVAGYGVVGHLMGRRSSTAAQQS